MPVGRRIGARLQFAVRPNDCPEESRMRRVAAVNVEDGKVAWTNTDYPFYSQHGLGASPIVHGDLLIMPFDGSSEGENKQVGWKIPWDEARVVALDAATGKERWAGKRGK